jgi:SPP1 gp7 family putative phage head morphogenesis protein
VSATPKPRSDRSDHGPGPNATDPTKTTTIRRQYAQRLRGRFAAINTEIRRAVRDRDFFGLSDGGAEQLAPQEPTPLQPYPFSRDDQKIERFEDWLQEQFDRGVLETISRGENRWIRSAYNRGVTHADTQLNKAGVAVDEETLESVFARGVAEEQLQRLYTRNYSALKGITSEVAKQVSSEITQGFARGINPNEMAQNITDRVDSIGKTRASVMARTETINAHAEGTLRRYEQLGVEEVTGKVEHLATNDGRTCEVCAALDGNTYTLEEAQGRIPIHPQCRCCWVIAN